MRDCFYTSFYHLLNPAVASNKLPSFPSPPRSVLAGSHTESWTVGQAARCKTLLGLRQQLCKGLLLQPILAARRGSHWSDVEPTVLLPFPSLAAFSAPTQEQHFFPTTGQGYFMLTLKCAASVTPFVVTGPFFPTPKLAFYFSLLFCNMAF